MDIVPKSNGYNVRALVVYTHHLLRILNNWKALADRVAAHVARSETPDHCAARINENVAARLNLFYEGNDTFRDYGHLERLRHQSNGDAEA